MKAAHDPAGRARELRDAFDRTFAAPRSTAHESVEDLLLARIASEPIAVRVREIAAVEASRPIVPLPAGARGLLGLAGIRSGIVPVFDLGVLLGHGDPDAAPRWLLLCRGDVSVALAVPALEGHLRLPIADLHPDPHAARDRFLPDVARTADGPRPVVAIPLVVAAVLDHRGQNRH